MSLLRATKRLSIQEIHTMFSVGCGIGGTLYWSQVGYNESKALGGPVRISDVMITGAAGGAVSLCAGYGAPILVPMATIAAGVYGANKLNDLYFSKA